jgi:hypothetical protein
MEVYSTIFSIGTNEKPTNDTHSDDNFMYGLEQMHCFEKWLYPSHRPIDFEISEGKDGPPVLRVQSAAYCCAGFFCCSPTTHITDTTTDTLLGWTDTPLQCTCAPSYTVKDGMGTTLYEVKPPVCCCGCCINCFDPGHNGWDGCGCYGESIPRYIFPKGVSEPIGTIKFSHHIRGLVPSDVYAPHYSIFGMQLVEGAEVNPSMKAVMLGTTFLLCRS